MSPSPLLTETTPITHHSRVNDKLQIQRTMEGTGSFHPQNIPLAITTLSSDTLVPVIHEKCFDGGQCRIYKVDELG